MFVIKTYVAASTIEGVGLFTGERVKKGAVIKKPIKGLYNLQIALKDLRRFPDAVVKFIKTYGAQQDPNGPYHLGLDNVRFLNHSENPNIAFRGKQKDSAVALRAIRKGEELTCDYRVLCSPKDWEVSREIISKAHKKTGQKN